MKASKSSDGGDGDDLSTSVTLEIHWSPTGCFEADLPRVTEHLFLIVSFEASLINHPL